MLPAPQVLVDNSLPYPQMAAAAFSPSGHLLATGNSTGNLYLWDVATLELVRRGKTGGSDRPSIVFTSNTRMIAGSKTLHTFDVDTLKRKSKEPRYKGHKAPPNGIVLTAGGQLVTAGGSYIYTDDRFLRC